MKAMIFGACAALMLAGCGSASEDAAQPPDKIDPAAVAEAVGAAVDVEAAKAVAKGIAQDALAEELPAGEIAAAAAIVNEEKLVSGIREAIGGQALREKAERSSEPGGQTAAQAD